MFHYAVFGQQFSSDLEFPDLVSATARDPDWTLRVASHAPPDAIAEQIGEHAVDRWFYRLYRIAGGFRLLFADHYIFDISETDSRIIWYPSPQATEENVRALVLGPLLALGHHVTGGISLHGSAVAIDDQGIAFLAPKLHGKSTLALALTRAGARLLTDDAVAVDLCSPPRVRPGVHSVRLWQDSVAEVGTGGIECRHLDGLKTTLCELPPNLLQTVAVPLTAIYLLEPEANGRSSTERIPITGFTAGVNLVLHTKLAAPLLGMAGSAEQLKRVGRLIQEVPTYRLIFARDFDLLPRLVDTLLAWHRTNELPPASPDQREASALG